MAILRVKTKIKEEVMDITEEVNSVLEKLVLGRGLCHLFLTHTTAALTTADLDPGGTDKDYLRVLAKMIPEPEGGFRHPHNPAHMPDHILSSIIGTSLVLAVDGGKLVLGSWQKVVLVEFDGPRERTILVNSVSMS